MLIHRDITCGVVVAAIGLLTILLSFQYDLGTITSLGPGYFPALLGLVMVGCGVAVLLSGVGEKPVQINVSWRGIAFVCAGMTSFIVGIRFLGYIPACFFSSFVTCFAHPRNSYFSSAIISIVITSVVVLIFYVILGQNHRLFGGL